LVSSPGRIRLEAFQFQGRDLSRDADPTVIVGSPYKVFLPNETNFPALRVVSVAGIPVPLYLSGSFTVPDVTLNESTAVNFTIEARNIPLNTIVRLQLYSEGGPDQIIDSSPLSGTPELSTATASAVLPPGFSRGFVRATWTPPAP
jgi:hypothetical protein